MTHGRLSLASQTRPPPPRCLSSSLCKFTRRGGKDPLAGKSEQTRASAVDGAPSAPRPRNPFTQETQRPSRDPHGARGSQGWTVTVDGVATGAHVDE